MKPYSDESSQQLYDETDNKPIKNYPQESHPNDGNKTVPSRKSAGSWSGAANEHGLSSDQDMFDSSIPPPHPYREQGELSRFASSRYQDLGSQQYAQQTVTPALQLNDDPRNAHLPGSSIPEFSSSYGNPPGSAETIARWELLRILAGVRDRQSTSLPPVNGAAHADKPIEAEGREDPQFKSKGEEVRSRFTVSGVRRTLSQRSAAHSGGLRPLLLSQDSRGGQTSRPNTPSPREQAVTTSHLNTPSATASVLQHPPPLTAGLSVPAATSPHLLTSSPPVSASYGGGPNTGVFPLSSAAQAGSAQGAGQSRPSTLDSPPTVRPSPGPRSHPTLISLSTPHSAFGEAGRATLHIPRPFDHGKASIDRAPGHAQANVHPHLRQAEHKASSALHKTAEIAPHALDSAVVPAAALGHHQPLDTAGTGQAQRPHRPNAVPSQSRAARFNATGQLPVAAGQDHQPGRPTPSGNGNVRNPGQKPHSVQPSATSPGTIWSGRPPAQRPDQAVRHASQPPPPIQSSRPANPVASPQLRSARRVTHPTQGQPPQSSRPVPHPSHVQSPQTPRQVSPPTHVQPVQNSTPSPPSFQNQVPRVPKQAPSSLRGQGPRDQRQSPQSSQTQRVQEARQRKQAHAEQNPPQRTAQVPRSMREHGSQASTANQGHPQPGKPSPSPLQGPTQERHPARNSLPYHNLQPSCGRPQAPDPATGAVRSLPRKPVPVKMHETTEAHNALAGHSTVAIPRQTQPDYGSENLHADRQGGLHRRDAVRRPSQRRVPDSVSSQKHRTQSLKESTNSVSHTKQEVFETNQTSDSASTKMSESGELSDVLDNLTPEVLYEMLLTGNVPDGLLYTVEGTECLLDLLMYGMMYLGQAFLTLPKLHHQRAIED